MDKQLEQLAEQIVDEANPKLKNKLEKQVKNGLAWMSKPLQDRVNAEIEYQSRDKGNVGFVCVVPTNGPTRLKLNGGTYDTGSSEITYEVRFFPLNSNFSQPGFASRMLAKGVKFAHVINKEKLDAFLTAVRTQSALTDETSGYEQNLQVISGASKAQAALEAKDRELAELRAELETMKQSKGSK